LVRVAVAVGVAVGVLVGDVPHVLTRNEPMRVRHGDVPVV